MFSCFWPLQGEKGLIKAAVPLYYYEVEYGAEVDVWLLNKKKPFPRELHFMEGRGIKKANLGLKKIRYGLNCFVVTFLSE